MPRFFRREKGPHSNSDFFPRVMTAAIEPISFFRKKNLGDPEFFV